MTAKQKQEIDQITKAYAAQCKTHRKGRYVFGDTQKPTFSSSVSFSDTGNDTNDDFKDEKAEAAINDIRRELIRSEIATSTGDFIKIRNNQLQTAKANKLKAVKELMKNRFGIG